MRAAGTGRLFALAQAHGQRNSPLSREPCLTSPKDFRRVSGTRHKVSVFQSSGEERAVWLGLAVITLAMAIGFSVLALEVEL